MYELLNPIQGEDLAPTDEMRKIWAATLSTTVVLACTAILWILRHPRPQFLRQLPGQLVLGFVTWPVVHSLVFGIFTLCLLVILGLGGEPEKHPFSQVNLAEAGWMDVLVLGLLACILAPFMEEFLFRGILIDWSVQRTLNPWIIGFLAVTFAVASGQLYAVAFVVLLCLMSGGWGYATRRVGLRTPVRVSSAVYVSSVLFATVHSGVWPSPIPLFVLGLFLGTLRVRTGGIAAGVVLHGLFNAVSFVYLLRGSA
jgi:membrane protease YdiL (CAAX protease family)